MKHADLQDKTPLGLNTAIHYTEPFYMLLVDTVPLSCHALLQEANPSSGVHVGRRISQGGVVWLVCSGI